MPKAARIHITTPRRSRMIRSSSAVAVCGRVKDPGKNLHSRGQIAAFGFEGGAGLIGADLV